MNQILARQLRRLGLDEETPPHDLNTWCKLLEVVDRSYHETDQPCHPVEPSLEVSAPEMWEERESLHRVSEAHLAHDRLRGVIDSLDVGLLVLDLDGRAVLANAAAERHLGVSEQDLIGDSVLNRFSFDTPVSDHLDRSFGLRSSVESVSALLHRGDERLPVSCVLNSLNLGGEATGSIFVFRDLSEWVAAHDAIERSEIRYRTLFQRAPVAIWEEDFSEVARFLEDLRASGVVDLRRYLEEHPRVTEHAITLIEVRGANQAAADLVEAEDPERLLGPMNPAVFTEETTASVIEQFLAVWNGSDRVEIELTGRTLNGERLDAILHWSVPRVGGQPDLSKVTVTITDITTRKLAEEQLAALVRSKDEFLASVSHEIRTPLTGIFSSAALLKEQWDRLDPEESADLIGFIVDESRDLAYIIDDLLVAARAEIGQLSILPEDIDLADEISKVREALRSHSLGDSVDTSAVQGRAFADPLRFRQIMRNLLTNAARYGGERIEVSATHSDGRVVLAVADNGQGIPEFQREAIFEPYGRVPSSNETPGSVGLGLTVSRRLARLMGGDITYDYRDGLSTFSLTLPAVSTG